MPQAVFGTYNFCCFVPFPSRCKGGRLWVDTPFDLSPPLTGGDLQNKISSPIRAQVIASSLVPSFCTFFFDKKPAFSSFRSRNRREYHKKSDKPPPAEPSCSVIRQKRFRFVGCRSPPFESLKTYLLFKLFRR